ncbi:MAG: gamma-glutamyl-phosphate reductase, partial [Chloroflexi bacterium]|nr:gamma-glutamyl-phosphate reductase [Chloroflexota bacterium]
MTTETIEDLFELGRAARDASRVLARMSSRVKNQALLNIADALD